MKRGTSAVTKLYRGTTVINKIYRGITKIWENWVFMTGTLKTATGSSSGSDFVGSSVAIGENVRVTEVYLTLTYSWDGTGTTSYGASISGYDINTASWFDLGTLAGEVLRPTTKTLSGTLSVSTANQERIISHIRVSGWGGLYCTSRSVSGSIKKWYQQG